jgi:hypothetical protein
MIEEKTAKVILQKKEKVTINNNTYEVEQPTTATLILISEQLAKLPNEDLDKENIIGSVLSNVQHGENIARSFAIMILGAKQIEKTSIIDKLFKTSKLERLTKEILHFEIKKYVSEYVRVMSSMQVQDFFMLITFLKEVNLTKETRKVIKTTVHGQ